MHSQKYILRYLAIPNRSVDNFEAMYNQVRHTPLVHTSSPSDVTSSQASTPDTPTTPERDLDDILNDPAYYQVRDRVEAARRETDRRGEPATIRRRAMAEDFSEGKLETIVDSPQKENAGTQTQYVSYQITTKVCIPSCSCTLTVELTCAA
jgi:hypothetical protein